MENKESLTTSEQSNEQIKSVQQNTSAQQSFQNIEQAVITKQERQIELSLGKINYEGSETYYQPTKQKTSSLEQVFKSNNYSPIVWKNNYRHSKNFLRTTGFCVDNDFGLTIEDTRKKLEKLSLNYALITTKSHTDKAHRFRVYLPFNRKVLSLKDYHRITKRILTDYFPSSDSSVTDGARQLFASPQNAHYEAVWDREDFDVDEELDDHYNAVRISNAWTEDLKIKTNKNSLINAIEITQKTPIYCPFHDDGSPSAFIEYSNKRGNFYISCSSCRKTFWMDEGVTTMEERCARYYSYGCDVYDIGILGEKFFIERIGAKKFYSLVGADKPQDMKSAYDYLVNNKHIRHLQRVDHLGDIGSKESSFQFNREAGIFEVRYRPMPVKLADNQFVEDYLENFFGQYKEFIKQWLAVYCYTNYKKLPTIVLKGPRGGGKNTFVEAIMKIYPSLSQFWHGEETNFTPEYEMKLLVADESVSKDLQQYKTLKKLSGQDMHMVNKKFQPQYPVRNNLNIIILSNSTTPIFVEKEEQPTNDKNNQFFVFDAKALTGQIDTQIAEKLFERLGNYIRTELRKVYDQVKDYTDCRYCIPTPITDEEKALFEANITTLESEIENLIIRMADGTGYMQSFFDSGYVPTEFFDRSYPKGYSKNEVIKKMKELKLLGSGNAQKFQVDRARKHCYIMTDKLKTRYLKERDDKGTEVSLNNQSMDTNTAKNLNE